MRMRIFQRNGWYHVETARGKSISLHTKDYDQAVKKVKKLGIKKPPCPYCGSEDVPSNRKFCSDICREKYWNDIERFGLPKSIILAAYDNKCAVCNADDERLIIHHVDGYGSTVDRKDRNNNTDNLIVLCSYCHLRIHAGKNFPFLGEGHYGDKRISDAIKREMKAIAELKNACKMPIRFPAVSMFSMPENDEN